MDNSEIIKELESLMRASNKLERRMDEVIYKEPFLSHIRKNEEVLKTCYNELQEISGDIQENISWNIQWLIKEIDPDWNVDKYLKETNYA